MNHALGILAEARDGLLTSYKSEFLRAEPGRLYSTLEDFRRADPSLKRVVVLGSTGSGKSTLLNILGGWVLTQRLSDYDFEWERRGGKEPLFRSEASTESVTRKVEFARLTWFGDPARPFYAVDTPGHDDSECRNIEEQRTRDKLHEHAVDLHNKLQALGQVHLILVLHGDIHSNRLNPTTYEILRMIDQKFAAAGKSVWHHVVVAYTKCNEHDLSWRSRVEQKKMEQQRAIRGQIPGCGLDVPVLCLGGAGLGGSGGSGSEGRSRSRSPRRQGEPKASSASTDFDKLWKLIADAPALDTSHLQPFEGADVKWQRIIDARDVAEARAKAARIYVGVVLRLFVLLALLFWRAWLIPGFVSRFLLLNLPGPYDEVCLLVLFAYWIGPMDVWYSLQHGYELWLQPHVQKLWEAQGHRHQD